MPEASDRRTFLKKSAVAASALAAGCGPKGSMEAEDQRALPAETLRAVGETVLPAELGPRGMGEVLSAFQRWLEEYAPVAELVHGYGSQEIGYGPPHPRPRWAAQLEALELEAHARHQAAFPELGVERRRALIERALGGGGDASLGDRPGALRAPHVVIGLLGFFYGGPDATNLCYRRRIDPSSCRPLAASGEEPPPIEERLAARSRTPSDGASSPSPPGAPRSTRFHPAAYERGLEPGS